MKILTMILSYGIRMIIILSLSKKPLLIVLQIIIQLLIIIVLRIVMEIRVIRISIMKEIKNLVVNNSKK